MTARETKIAKAILTELHNLDGGQAHALTIHAGVLLGLECSADEFDEVLKQLDARRLVIGVKTEFKGMLWSISDLGEAARRKM